MKNQNIAGRLAASFIHHPLTPLFVFIILFLGYIALSFMPREENPQIKVSGAVVIISLKGASSSEVQKVIIEPLEEVIKEIKGVEHIFSYAKESMAIVQVQFYIGEDKNLSNFILFNQVMRNMDKLPQGASLPLIKTMDIDTDIPIATLSFYSSNKNISNVELYKKVYLIKKEIIKLDNVAKVSLKGENQEQYNILLHLNKLSLYKISINDVKKSLESLSFVTPLVNTNTKNNKLLVFGIEKQIKSVDDLNNLLISTNAQNAIYLRNVARVEKSYDIQNKKEALLYIKKDGVFTEEIRQISLNISKQKASNSVLINKNILKYLESIKDDLKKQEISYVITRDDGYTANNAVNSLVSNLVISIFIIFILLVFTLGFKEASIVSIMVPMILSITLFIGFLFEQTINRITLFALLVALGMLVDATIIVIENINRHKKLYPRQNLEILTINATNEIGNATNIATLAIIITFIPMYFVGGMMGEFMKPLPIFVPIALVVSLLIAYIFTAYFIIKFTKVKKNEKN